MIRIVYADDMQECMEYYGYAINEQEDMEIIKWAASGQEAVDAALSLEPDIVLMDVSMEDKDSGITATQTIVERNPGIKVIILTSFDDNELILRAFMVGAADFLIKMSPKDEIIDKIRKVYAQDGFIGQKILTTIRNHLGEEQKEKKSLLYIINYISRLTQKEHEVFNLLLACHTKNEIIQIMHIEEATYKTHINNVLKKLGYTDTKSMLKDMKKMNIHQLMS